ncbi:MAG: CPBP family glutamic-type intramembrane protease, partial [Bacteroidales bacterium]
PYDITRNLFVGFLLGYLYYRYNSILIPIVCHILWNLLGVVLKTTGNDLSIWMILIYSCSLVGFVFLFRNLLKGQYAELISDKSLSGKSEV